VPPSSGSWLRRWLPRGAVADVEEPRRDGDMFAGQRLTSICLHANSYVAYHKLAGARVLYEKLTSYSGMHEGVRVP